MSVKNTALHQYQRIADDLSNAAKELRRPKEGWIRTVRKALHMSGAQLGRRMGVSRARISYTEKAELNDSVTLSTMHKAADALGCKFVYAFVPKDSTQNIVAQRALEKAESIVDKVSKNMALEAQSIDSEKRKFETEQLKTHFLYKLPSNLWDDD